MDQIINLHDFPASSLQERLELAGREYPNMKIVYVGRPQGGFPVKPSPLRSKFWLSSADAKDPKKRADSIEAYRRDLYKLIKAGDVEVLAALRAIDDSTILACWCYPLPCHSQVIWAAWHWLMSKDAAKRKEAVSS